MSMRDKIAETAENIMFRRVTQEKLVGYTVEASKEIADAILAAIKAGVPPLVWMHSTQKKHDGCDEYAETENGTYFICDDSDDFTGYYCKFVSLGKCTWFGTGEANSEAIISGVHNVDFAEIKAAAQKHHAKQRTGWMDK